MNRTPGPHETPPRRWLRWGFAGLTLLFVLSLTLGGEAADAASAESTSFWCLLCGTFGTADFLLNIALFVPLGAALRLLGLSTPLVYLLGLALSGLVETLQLSMPGRFSVAGDLVANSLGALLGALAVGRGPLSILRPTTWKRHATALIGVGVVWLVTAASFLPSLPPSAYYGQWTAELGQYAIYRGTVIEASIGDSRAPGHRLGDSDRARAAILAGAPVIVTFAAGPAPDRLAPIFSIFDDHQREILLIGAEGADLVVKVRRRAADIGLHGPALRWPDALRGVQTGDTVTVAVWREDGSRICAALAAERHCHVPGVGRGWALLLGDERAIPRSADRLADLGWLAVTAGIALSTAPGVAGVAGGAGVLGAVLILAELCLLR